MKVLLTHSSADLYGSDRMAAEAAGALVDRGHEVCVVLPSEGPLTARMRQTGAQVRELAVPVLRKANLRPRGFITLLGELVRTAPGMWGVMRDVQPDVVYVNTVTQPWWLVLSRLRRLPSITHVREAEPQLPRAVGTALMLPLLLSDLVICNSRSTQQEVRRAVPAPSRRVRVIYNGKDWSRYALEEQPQARSAPSGVLTIVVVGRLSPRKGQDVVVRALGEMVTAGLDARLRLVGDVFPGYEWYEEELRDLARSLGVADRVELVGFLDDILPELGAADIAVVPSRIEPFGTVAAESMAAGVLTIVSEVQGLTEIVTDGHTGLTFPSEDAGALAKHCLWAARNVRDASRISQAGRESVRRRFTLQLYRTQIVEALEGVASPHRPEES
ncbi:glycosyltransferase family 4 protein [Ornithinicoccus halotolerans]|uniref:glycosyltransferase family 4 protein n=1 Tax=Ornithinicoccus halotolerans TaxID=1748220 RepID=UPI001295455D|nr:glycosyltransferase family 4 protein [Ornithinicoccus halotolerans]